jgi:hypothetical protein
MSIKGTMAAIAASLAIQCPRLLPCAAHFVTDFGHTIWPSTEASAIHLTLQLTD